MRTNLLFQRKIYTEYYQKHIQLHATVAGTKQGIDTIQPQSLPPTSAAAMSHSMRVYHQVHQLKGEREAFSAEECGWKATDDQLAPLMTHLQPASETLLHVVRSLRLQ
ncbi:hypothetical protein OS493_030388 [Desmophyllum pertusum]|uniref:Uncharacterized protein n=1 Tax=Desmophyllum pertusum TaxID=174260 RepID=A0A9X0CWQ7_9CNID|nr:hypothetical protein OS493_030388 [Desmophyllum pertusum]